MPWYYPEVVPGCHFASASGRACSCTTSQEVLEPVSPLHLGGPVGGAYSPPNPCAVKLGGWAVVAGVWRCLGGYCLCTLPPVPSVVLGWDPGLCELLESELRSVPMGCPQGVRPRMAVGSLKGFSASLAARATSPHQWPAAWRSQGRWLSSASRSALCAWWGVGVLGVLAGTGGCHGSALLCLEV